MREHLTLWKCILIDSMYMGRVDADSFFTIIDDLNGKIDAMEQR